MPEERRLVTVLFADVVGSTAFGADNDPEVVRSVMGRYFERMKTVAETNGGTVEKFIGDAVMVVFGVPRLHDDDAERAVRAALAMREEVADLDRELDVDLAVRIGVNSGHAVASTTSEQQFLVTGDAVNVAARLQQGADAGEVVVGALTEQLTRAAIDYAPRVAITAKGKAEPIAAFAVVRARSAIPEQARGLPSMRAQLVGRQRELRSLLDAFDRVKDERRAHVFTVIGSAGLGKSRLVGEALARMSTAGGARVLRGRCLPYGAGITYWPLIELVRADAGISPGDDRAAALAKLGYRAHEIFTEAEVRGATSRLAVLLGLEQAAAALPEIAADAIAQELGWVARRYLEGVAREPAIVAIDDLQWAEPPVLDLIDGLADFASDVPLLLLCVARPQLLEARPTWGAVSANGTRITLAPLTPEETGALIGRLLDIDELPPDLRDRIVDRSGGNPLFCEEFIRMLLDEGRIERAGGRWRATASLADVRIPESIEALIAARLDGLAPAEKQALQVASVIGEQFATAQAIALAGDATLGEALEALRRKDLVVRERAPDPTGEDVRFKHMLIREVAYASLPKVTRAALHERFGELLRTEVGDRLDEYAEILGYHAERAFTLSVELRLAKDVVRARALRVLRHALALAERGRDRQDIALLKYAAVARAAAGAIGDDVSAEDRIRIDLVAAEALSLGGGYVEAIEAYRRAAETAASAGLRRLEGQAHLGVASTAMWVGVSIEVFSEAVKAAARAFAAAADSRGILECDVIRLEVAWSRGAFREILKEGKILLARARDLNDPAMELRIAGRLIPAAFLVGDRELADRLDATAVRLAREIGAREPSLLKFGRCKQLEMDDRLDDAESCYRAQLAEARAAGRAQLIIGCLRNIGEILIARRRYEEAAEAIDEALALSARIHEQWSRAELTASRALIHLARAELDLADNVAQAARGAANEGDAFARIRTDLVAAHVAAARGRLVEARGLFDGAVAALRDTDFGADMLDPLVGYAELLTVRGLPGAPEAIQEAQRILDATGVAFTRERLRLLRPAHAR